MTDSLMDGQMDGRTDGRMNEQTFVNEESLSRLKIIFKWQDGIYLPFKNISEKMLVNGRHVNLTF